MNRERRYVKLVIDRKAALLLLAVIVLVGAAGILSSQQLSMTASYPIPAGVYNQIVTTGNSGTTAANTTLNRNAGNTIMVPPTNVGGRVGIGTAAPGAMLHVAGATQVDGAATVNGAVSAGSLAVAGNETVSGTGLVKGALTVGTAGSPQSLTVNGDMGGKTITTTGAGSIGAGLTVANTATASDWCTQSGKCLSGAVQGPLPPGSGITSVNCSGGMTCSISGNTLNITPRSPAGVHSVSCPGAWGCGISGETLTISPPSSVAGVCPTGWTCSVNPQNFVTSISPPPSSTFGLFYTKKISQWCGGYNGSCSTATESCYVNNPITGICSCPSGYNANGVIERKETVFSINYTYELYLCWR